MPDIINYISCKDLFLHQLNGHHLYINAETNWNPFSIGFIFYIGSGFSEVQVPGLNPVFTECHIYYKFQVEFENCTGCD